MTHDTVRLDEVSINSFFLLSSKGTKANTFSKKLWYYIIVIIGYHLFIFISIKIREFHIYLGFFLLHDFVTPQIFNINLSVLLLV